MVIDTLRVSPLVVMLKYLISLLVGLVLGYFLFRETPSPPPDVSKELRDQIDSLRTRIELRDSIIIDLKQKVSQGNEVVERVRIRDRVIIADTYTNEQLDSAIQSLYPESMYRGVEGETVSQ